jgi:hypothetical protein
VKRYELLALGALVVAGIMAWVVRRRQARR